MTAEELDELPEGSVVIGTVGKHPIAYQKGESNRWWGAGDDDYEDAKYLCQWDKPVLIHRAELTNG